MHVLMIAQSVYDYDPRIIRLASALVKNNHKVSIICLQYGHQGKYEEMNGVHVYRIMNYFSQDKITSYIFYSFLFLIKSLIKSVRLTFKEKFSLVHVHNMPDYLVFAALFHKLAGIPIILDIHDLTVELFREKWGEKKFKILKPLLETIEKLCVGFSNRVVTVSEQCAERLMERGLPKRKLTVVMNVPDSDVFNYHAERSFHVINSELQLIYHGTVAERYGLHRAIEAVSEVVTKIPNTVFNIYGNSDTDYDKYLVKLVDDLKMKDNVNFNGVVSYKLVGEKIKEADIALVMSVNSEYTNFGIPTKIFEYAITGIPCVCTELRSVKTVFGEDSVCYVDPENPVQIAREIINLCKRRKAMSENAYMRFQKVNGEIMRSRYLDLITSMTQINN